MCIRTKKSVKEPQRANTLNDDMMIDPVVEIADKLRNAEQKPHDDRVRRDPVRCREVVAEISALNEQLFVAAPTRALGAAELLERIAYALDESSKPCAYRLR